MSRIYPRSFSARRSARCLCGIFCKLLNNWSNLTWDHWHYFRRSRSSVNWPCEPAISLITCAFFKVKVARFGGATVSVSPSTWVGKSPKITSVPVLQKIPGCWPAQRQRPSGSSGWLGWLVSEKGSTYVSHWEVPLKIVKHVSSNNYASYILLRFLKLSHHKRVQAFPLYTQHLSTSVVHRPIWASRYHSKRSCIAALITNQIAKRNTKGPFLSTCKINQDFLVLQKKLQKPWPYSVCIHLDVIWGHFTSQKILPVLVISPHHIKATCCGVHCPQGSTFRRWLLVLMETQFVFLKS